MKEIIRRMLIAVCLAWLERRTGEPGDIDAPETWYVYDKDMGLNSSDYGLDGRRIVVSFHVEDWHGMKVQ